MDLPMVLLIVAQCVLYLACAAAILLSWRSCARSPSKRAALDKLKTSTNFAHVWPLDKNFASFHFKAAASFVGGVALLVMKSVGKLGSLTFIPFLILACTTVGAVPKQFLVMRPAWKKAEKVEATKEVVKPLRRLTTLVFLYPFLVVILVFLPNLLA